MDKFIELVRDMHDECYEFVLQKIISQKIPVALLSAIDEKNSFETAKNFRRQLNLTHFITLSGEKLSADFEIISVQEAINKHLRPEYIFALNQVDARFAAKNFPATNPWGNSWKSAT